MLNILQIMWNIVKYSKLVKTSNFDISRNIFIELLNHELFHRSYTSNLYKTCLQNKFNNPICIYIYIYCSYFVA